MLINYMRYTTIASWISMTYFEINYQKKFSYINEEFHLDIKITEGDCHLCSKLFRAISFAAILLSCPAQAEEFDGWGFGIGIGFEIYNDSYIKKASINGDKKIVSIDEDFKYTPALWSAVNWTATDCKNISWICSTWVKPGWFVGAKLVGESGAGLEGAAIGFQWAFLRPQAVTKADGSVVNEKRKSLNIGIGISISNFQKLNRGIEEGEPLPNHYDDISYRKTTEPSLLIIISKDITI